MELIIVLIIEGIISYIVKDLFNDIDILSIIFIIINTIPLCLYIIKKVESRNLVYILIFGLILRTILLFIDIYMFKLPHSGADTESFNQEAMKIYNNIDYFKIALMGNYTKFLGIFYTIFGPQRLLAQYTNIILDIVLIANFIWILKFIGVKSNIILKMTILYSFLPHNLIFSSVLLREKLVGLNLMLSIKYFIRWIALSRYKSLYLSILYLSIGSLFHSGIIAILIIYIIIFSFYQNKKRRLVVSTKSLGILLFVGIPIILIIVLFPNIFMDKFSNITDMQTFFESISKESRGNSAYLVNLRINNILQLILYSPIKIAYFIFSPMPWNIRGVMDIVAFIFDSSIYIYLVLIVIINYKYVNISDTRELFKILLVCLGILLVVFALGTSNTGTALRHRNKILPILLILSSISLNEKNNNLKNYEFIENNS